VHRPRSNRGGAGQIASRPRRPEGAGDKSCHGRVETGFADDRSRFDASIRPARAGSTSDVWLYFVGPIAGGVVAALLYLAKLKPE
jgi:hypothetical protein